MGPLANCGRVITITGPRLVWTWAVVSNPTACIAAT